MSIHVSGCTAELCRVGKKLELTDLFLKTDYEHIELLAHACRGCRLAMSLGKHRNLCPLFCHTLDKAEYLFEKRHEALVNSFLERKWNRGVVDVLRSKTEMHELTPFEDVHFLETVLDEVLDSLYIVVCNLLDLLYLGCVFWSHISIDVPQSLELR